ncbi:hypothetical protein BDZ97DRAFT_403348 [Flammula alnicola]|nr:hypothetical protein BDZ97DRAFT_403348 [Flammula alnicola]
MSTCIKLKLLRVNFHVPFKVPPGVWLSHSSTISRRNILEHLMMKRSHPYVLAANSSSANDVDVDIWRKGKRRRSDNPHSTSVEKFLEPRSCPCQYENRLHLDQETRFATTAAQFNLSSRTGRSTVKTRRLQTFDPQEPQERQHGYLTDLVRLRSSAFWELRQSITESGEGLVRRMRDYERSRSRHQTHQKAKEAEKLGRKRLSNRRKKTFVNTSDASEDEDILICSGESANHILRGSFLGKRARSLDAMDIDVQHTSWSPTQHSRSQGFFSSPDTHYTFSSPILQSDEEDATFLEDPRSFTVSLDEPTVESTPSLSHFACESASSSLVSLPLPSSDLPHTKFCEPSLSLPSTASEKALAALNLSLANGAGSISDYSSVWKYQERFKAESYDNGDLWR